MVTGTQVIAEDPATASIEGTRPLNQLLKMAVVAGVETAVQLHIERGDDLNGRDSNGLTPLMLSAARNKSIICRLLLDAGADYRLLAPSGKNALAIAVAAGAQEAVAVLNGSVANPIAPVARSSQSAAVSIGVHPESTVIAIKRNGNLFGENESDKVILHSDSPDEVQEAGELNGATEFDLSSWEAEEYLPPPLVDPAIALAACELQATITTHEPFDSSTDWDDIDAFLPDRASPLLRSDDAETAERLRLLLLRAVREGSVPHTEVKALSFNDDESDSLEAESILCMVLNDLGAEVDERIEYARGPASFQVFIKPETTPDEEEIVASALVFIDNLASHRTEPLRIYQKEFQRQRLISAQEEVLLGQAMESAIERALDALAAWPGGIARILAAGKYGQDRASTFDMDVTQP